MNLQIDVTNWKLRQYRDFLVATKEGDFDKIIEILSQLITAWDFSGDPKDVDFWLDNLNIMDWQAILTQFTKLLSEKFNTKN